MIARLLLACALCTPAAAVNLDTGSDYGMVVDIASRSKVAFAGTTDVVSRTLLHVRLRANADGTVSATQQVCDVKLLSDSRAETVLPDAFIRAMPRQTYAVRLVETDGNTSFSADPGPTYVGYDPALSGGGVPSGADDPGVVDMDRDGRPGVTVHVVMPVFGAVKIYVAQRGHSRYEGQVGEGGVSGRVDIVALEQNTLGASFAPFAANPQITAVPESSRFDMRPIASGLTCADLRARWAGEYRVPQ